MEARRNLQIWDVFFSLVRTGSVTQTSFELNRSGSDISKMIRSLEKDLGFALFDRTKRPFAPTQRALSLAEEIQPLVRSLDRGIGRVIGGTQNVLLRVAAPIDLSIDFLDEQILDYSDLHPNVSFSVSHTPGVKTVLEGTADVVLMQRPADSSNLVIRPCITCGCCPLASPQYLEKHGTPHSLSELREHTGLLLRWNEEPPTQHLYSGDGVPSEMLRWKKAFVADNQITLRTWALNHRGIALDIAASGIVQELKEGKLVPVLPDWHRKSWELCVVTRSDREEESSEIRDFASWWAVREGIDSMRRYVTGSGIITEMLGKKPFSP